MAVDVENRLLPVSAVIWTEKLALCIAIEVLGQFNNFYSLQIKPICILWPAYFRVRFCSQKIIFPTAASNTLPIFPLRAGYFYGIKIS